MHANSVPGSYFPSSVKTGSHAAIHAMTHVVPPELLNPLNFNPLKDLLLKVVDFTGAGRGRSSLCRSAAQPLPASGSERYERDEAVPAHVLFGSARAPL